MADPGLKKGKEISWVADASFSATYPTLNTFSPELMQHHGPLGFMIVPIIDLAKAVLYWFKSEDFDENKKWLNRGFYTGKFFMTGVGAGLTIAGKMLLVPFFVMLGMSLVITGGSLATLRSAYKGIQAYRAGDTDLAEKYLYKFVINALFTAATVLLVFFPQVILPVIFLKFGMEVTLGWGLMIGTAAYLLAPVIASTVTSGLKKLGNFLFGDNEPLVELKKTMEPLSLDEADDNENTKSGVFFSQINNGIKDNNFSNDNEIGSKPVSPIQQ